MKPEQPKQRTILFAEDDALLREIAAETLRTAGFAVVEAADGQAALEALAEVQPDLVLTDVRMPRRDGLSLLQQLRRTPEFRLMPVVIMSAKADRADQRMGMSLGADDYVTKPYDPVDLVKTIQVRLERAELISGRIRHQQFFLTKVLPHELRTPLTGVIGYADLMVVIGESGETLAPAELADYGHNLARSGQRLLKIVEDFSLWAELSLLREQQGAERRPGEAGAVSVVQLRTMLGAVAERLAREQDLKFAADVAVLDGVHHRYGWIAAHLVENALKFSLPGAEVLAALREHDGGYELVVLDRGRGMTDAELAALGPMRQFRREQFEQQGLGMGLALAFAFAAVAGGEFTLRRREPGPGMEARLWVPKAGSPANRPGTTG